MLFKRVCKTYGFLEESYGTIVTINNTEYKLVGISTRARKYPITLERCKDGNNYGFSLDIRESILK